MRASSITCTLAAPAMNGALSAGALLLFLSLAVPAHCWAASSTRANAKYRTASTIASTTQIDPLYSSVSGSSGYAAAGAVADAAHGTIGGYSTTVFGSPSGVASTLGEVTDFFTLNGPVGGAHYTFSASLRLDGILVGVPTDAGVTPHDATVSASLVHNDDYSNVGFLDATNGGSSHTPQQYDECYKLGCLNGSFNVPIHMPLSISFDAAAGTPFKLYYLLKTSAYQGAYADFYHTAALSFDLPAGTTITSVGGFSQAAVAAVPEPEICAMMLAGLGLLGFTGWRRNTTRQ